ncbi:store-operated calcium entry-associated regulatory factor [Podospora aff. communis PSN243]|uniref:Store-operated calcium entry-associated regulatory factor n=1 Tax=Podospora aff. communis PSN243 TaxID=3040156 RepID=A0AAV9H593_9PEZI|nr:store-operated calcium entry-associated regulatory factor [Podospora aff. communis PSN243]
MRRAPSSLAHILLLALALLTTPALAKPKPKTAILLSNVQSLTLSSTRPTTHRRVSPIPQLKCISSPRLCKLYTIPTMRCTNQGSSYSSEDIEWACTAELPSTLKLGSTEVICEGYDSPDDPYVLKGSCGVEYRLVLTEEGERVYPELAGHGGGGGGGFMRTEEGNVDWAGVVFGVVFLGVLVWIVVGACTAGERNRAAPRAGGGRRPGGGGGGPGGWGGGGGGGWDDPPPPYPGTKPSGAGEGWRPGFWTGLAGGAAAGYMAGNRGPRDDRRYNQGGSMWGGRNTGGSGWASGSGSSASSSGARHESTGFGSTSRR